MRLLALTLALCLPLAVAAQDIDKINGEVSVDAGQHAGDVHSVNGSVDIGAGAIVHNASTVNGTINLGENAQADTLHTVNGSLTLNQGSRVTDWVKSANGDISLEPHSDVKNGLANANGTITLDHAHIGGSIDTANGDITVGEGSHVDGGIVVEAVSSFGWHSANRPPHIVIGPHAVVTGTLEFHRDVVLDVSNSAQIGAVHGATPHRFSGATP